MHSQTSDGRPIKASSTRNSAETVRCCGHLSEHTECLTVSAVHSALSVSRRNTCTAGTQTIIAFAAHLGARTLPDTFWFVETRKFDHAHATMLTTGLVRLGDEEKVCAVRTCMHHRRHRRNQLPALRCSRPGCAPGAPRPERDRRPPSEPPGTAGTAWWSGTGSCVRHHAPTFTSCAPPDSLLLSQCGGRCSRTLF